MKNRFLQLVIVLSIFVWNAKAQNLITVQNDGESEFFTNLDSAIVHALDGDTIYIPGGCYNPNIPIAKRLHLVGAGHHPDSANITDRTVFNTIIFDAGSDFGSITGIYFSDNFYCNEEIEGVTVSRCRIYTLRPWNYNDESTIINWAFTENIFLSALSLSCINCLFSNSIFVNRMGVSESVLRNNIFTYQDPWGFYYCLSASNCLIENNIFPSPFYLGSYNIYHNNVNSGINGVSGINQGSGNFITDYPSLESIFVNYHPQTWGINGIYEADFHLPPDSPFKNAGTDGTDIGIYGGTFPWKDGSVPFNPHFQSVIIPGATDQNGNLNVNIKVAAQDN